MESFPVRIATAVLLAAAPCWAQLGGGLWDERSLLIDVADGVTVECDEGGARLRQQGTVVQGILPVGSWIVARFAEGPALGFTWTGEGAFGLALEGSRLVLRPPGNRPPRTLALSARDKRGVEELLGFKGSLDTVALQDLADPRVPPVLRRLRVRALVLDRAPAVGVLPSLGGLVRLDMPLPKDLSVLDEVGKIPGLDKLVLRDCAALKDLADLRGARRARRLALLNATGVADLGGLAGYPNLQSLELPGAMSLTDAQDLRSLPSLRRLDLSGASKLTDLAWLKALHQLQSLDLAGASGLRDLSPVRLLSRLETLHLPSTTTDTALREVFSSAMGLQLRDLSLAGCAALTDLSPLLRLRNLRTLDVSGCPRLPEAHLADVRWRAGITQIVTLPTATAFTR